MEPSMHIQNYAYSHSPSEFAELRELLISSYTGSRAPLNWRLAMLENWYYASRYLEVDVGVIDQVADPGVRICGLRWGERVSARSA
jgi:hypothetical protein